MYGRKINNSSILKDRYNRTHNYLRISLTDKCNFLCSYCKPESKQCNLSKDNLSANDIGLLASAFIDLGINKIRLTGGEPLTRRDFPEIAHEIGKFNIKKAITTNGFLLDQYLDVLHKNNFTMINVSLDSLSQSKFQEITGVNQFEMVFRNLLLAIDKKFEVKLNVVLIKGVNDDEINDFAQLARDLPFTIRFIEFMPFKGIQWDNNKLVSHDEIIQTLSSQFVVKPVSELTPSNPAKYYTIGAFKGKIGIISTISKPFCDNCNRIRITSDGKIKSCLFGRSEIDLIEALRNGKNIKELIQSSITGKPSQHQNRKIFNIETLNDQNENKRGMYAIGG